MAVAGALVVPVDKKYVATVKARLQALPGVAVQDMGPKGIAVVLEGADPAALKKTSEEVLDWREVIDFQLAYLNWEDDEDEG